jgi:small-conductance mechanosensitive channel
MSGSIYSRGTWGWIVGLWLVGAACPKAMLESWRCNKWLVGQRWLSLMLAFCLGLGLLLVCSTPVMAQFPGLEGLGSVTSSGPPPGVQRYGSIEVAPVKSPINGDVLFTVASPTVYDRNSNDSSTPVEKRAEEVTSRLWRAITRPMDPETLKVQVSRLNNVTIIEASDATYTRPLILVSVTSQDADFYGKPIADLAAEWRNTLNKELRDGLRQLTFTSMVQSLKRGSTFLAGLVAFSLLIMLLKYAIRSRQQVLRRQRRELKAHQQSVEGPADPQQSQQVTPAPEHLDQQRTQFLQRLKQTLSLERRLGFWELVQWLLFWTLILVWYFGLYRIFSQIPFLARLSTWILGVPVQLLVIWFVTGLAIRISRRLIDRLKTTWEDHEFLNLGDAQRRVLRTSTIAGAVKGMVTVLIMVMGLLAALNTLGIPTGSVLAIGGLLGLAISFGSQSLVKDLVNGCLILAEDQFAIGDVIDLGHVSGLVENLNLRVTQLRSADGELVTTPNSAITEVKNLTRSWSRVNFSIDVAYQTDPRQALAVLRQVSQDFYDDPEWHEKLLNPPDVLGIDSVSHQGMSITIWIQTAPAQQWAVGREFRLRVRQALEANGIAIGVPRQAYEVETASNGHSDRSANPTETPSSR